MWPARRYAVIALVLSAAPRAVEAQSENADALLRHGVELRRDGQDDAALAYFRRAYQQVHSANALAQMGLAEQALGRWVDAEAHLREALASRDDPWLARNRAVIAEAHAAVSEHVGRLEVRGNVAGTTLRVNGVPVGTLPLRAPIPLAIGTVVLEAQAPGYYPLTRNVLVTGGGLARETLELRRQRTPSIASSPATGSESADGHGPQRVAGWTLVGGGAVFLGAAVGFNLWRENMAQDFNTNCPAMVTPPGDSPCARLLSNGTIATWVSVAGYAAAGALGLVGLVLVATTPGAQHTPHTTRARGIRPRCTQGPGDLGLACAVEF